MLFRSYDAPRAGFETVIFVIKKENEADFRAAIGDRLSQSVEVRYAFQDLRDLPAGYAVPEGRVKPWGTCHAVLAARDMVDGPFAVVNADDCYGPAAFREIFAYLSQHPDRALYEYAMAGYLLRNTVTEHGSVARGICREDEDHWLLDVTERTQIEKDGDDARFTEDGGSTWTALPGDTVVSMNMWGFHKSFLEEAERRLPVFLDQILRENPLKGEFYLPALVSQLLAEGKARVRVLQSRDRWYGVTYRADKPAVEAALAAQTAAGLYPEKLWPYSNPQKYQQPFSE